MYPYNRIREQLKNIISGVFEVQGNGVLARWVCMIQIVKWSMISRKLQLILILLTMSIGSLGLAATYFVGLSAKEQLWSDLDQLMGSHVRVYASAGPNNILLRYRPLIDLTPADLSYIRQQVTEARHVEPILVVRKEVEHKQKRLLMMVDGITPILEKEPAYHPISGPLFSKEAHESIVFECHLTQSAFKFFSIDMDKAPYIRIGAYRFLVRNIVPDPVEADPPYRLRVILPYQTVRLLWGGMESIGNMLVFWHSPDEMENTINALRKALDTCRAPNAYVLSSSQYTLKKRKNIVSNFMLFSIIQAAFCILVSSIGIVNVMLASVSRRAREFAIRIAMGARYRDIAVIVLTESFLLGISGALLGILSAIILSPLLCRAFALKIEEASQLQPQFGIQGILIPLLVCGLCGFIAGLIPAIKATRIDILTVLNAE